MTTTPISLLVVDDDDTFRKVLARELRAMNLQVDTRSDGGEVEAALLESNYDVVVLDLRMVEMDGIATLERIKSVRPLTEVIILTGHGSCESAVQALKLGAFDFLTKPCDLDHLESVIRRAAQARAMRSENATLRQALSRHNTSAELIGTSNAISKTQSLIDKVGKTESTVLIRGESGSGKEIVAQAIRQASPRRERPYVVLDCGATEEHLALSELFGHERGAFTGATSRSHGLFEIADSGTILIDEVGDAPLSLQTRLLRVLETGTLRRLGSEESIRVDVRVLAATHRDLEAGVRAGTFREDLYYRLNVFTIEVPPLRDRIDDLPALVDHFLNRLCSVPPEVEPEAMVLLQQYRWPGNVRELRNVIERAVILSDGLRIGSKHLPHNLSMATTPWSWRAGQELLSLQEVERRYLQTLLDQFEGQRGKVAAALGISERTLYRKLRGSNESDNGQD